MQVARADLTSELKLPPADWVLALEVAEHVPRSVVQVFHHGLQADAPCQQDQPGRALADVDVGNALACRCLRRDAEQRPQRLM